MIDRTTIAANPATIPQRLGERGFEQLARLGTVALKAAEMGDTLAAVSQTGITPSFARDLLAALEPVASAAATQAQSPVAVNINDPKSVAAGFARGQITSIAFDARQLRAFGEALVEMVTEGQASSAVLAFKSFESLRRAGGITWGEGLESYFSSNAVSSLTSKLRNALEAAGVNPREAGIPEPGPQML